MIVIERFKSSMAVRLAGVRRDQDKYSIRYDPLNLTVVSSTE